jgi:hypothetical protein
MVVGGVGVVLAAITKEDMAGDGIAGCGREHRVVQPDYAEAA